MQLAERGYPVRLHTRRLSKHEAAGAEFRPRAGQLPRLLGAYLPPIQPPGLYSVGRMPERVESLATSPRRKKGASRRPMSTIGAGVVATSALYITVAGDGEAKAVVANSNVRPRIGTKEGEGVAYTSDQVTPSRAISKHSWSSSGLIKTPRRRRGSLLLLESSMSIQYCESLPSTSPSAPSIRPSSYLLIETLYLPPPPPNPKVPALSSRHSAWLW